MQLLTPLIRARIQSMVLDAIARIPPNIQPTDSRFLEWIESLIRYHAQHPMDPAAEKPPVLGGIGVADQYHASDALLEDLYIETGVNDTGSVGVEDPDRFLPGTWKTGTGGDGAPDSGDYQGIYNSDSETYDAENESLAIGEGDPDVDDPPPAQHQLEAVYAKKLVVGYFPPSVFNGIMLHYMQAYYGADNELTMQFQLDKVGTQVVLKLPNTIIGFYSHASVGILHVGADNNLDYRFVVIESPTGEGLYSVKECDIIFPLAEDARAEFEDAGTSDADREKVLTYLFGHSKIDDLNFREVDTFELDNLGTDASQGWKFNNVGTEASICLTEKYIDPSTDWHWDSSEIIIEFGVNIDDEIVIDDVTESIKVRWRDQRNVQLWVPNTDFTTTTRKYRTPLAKRPDDYNYTDAPVYCWYDEADVLQVMKFSHTVETYATTTKWKWSDNITPTTIPPTDYDNIREGFVVQGEARWYSQATNSTNGTTDTVSVNSTDYDMVSTYGSITWEEIPEHDGGEQDQNPHNFVLCTLTTWSPGDLKSPDCEEWTAEGRSPIDCYYRYGAHSYTVTSGDGWLWDAVAIHIPLRESEGVYVATLNYAEFEGDEDATEFSNPSAILAQRANGDGRFGATPITIDPLFALTDAKPKWGICPTCTDESTTPGDVYGEIAMFVWTRTVEGEEGIYVGSVDQYFFRGDDAEDPPGKILAQSWGVDALYGTDVGALGDTDTNRGVWTGWI